MWHRISATVEVSAKCFRSWVMNCSRHAVRDEQEYKWDMVSDWLQLGQVSVAAQCRRSRTPIGSHAMLSLITKVLTVMEIVEEDDR
jgi:hypothetical protein